MKRVELKSMSLENYKKFPGLMSDFYGNTLVSGRNREGKTTISNAYFDILTGKEVDGTEPDGIRPHGKNGEEIIGKDDSCIRSIVLSINDSEIDIAKITKQKWVKKHGETERVFSGNETTYEIDGYKKNKKQFSDTLTEEIATPETILLCSNPNVFLNMLKKSTADARQAIERISGFDIELFIKSNDEYEKAVEIIGRGTAEDCLKKLKKQQSELSKKMDLQNGMIANEKKNYVPNDKEKADSEFKEYIETAKVAKEKLEAQKKELNETNARLYANLDKARADFQKGKEELSVKYLSEYEEKKNSLEAEIWHTSAEIDKNSNDIFNKRSEESKAKDTLKKLMESYKDLKERFDANNVARFDDSALNSILEMDFIADEITCPSCGNKFLSAEQEKAKKLFTEKKEKQISDLQNRRADFEQTKAETKQRLIEESKDIVSKIEAVKASERRAASLIAEKEKALSESKNHYKELKSKLSAIEKPKLEAVPEYNNLCSESSKAIEDLLEQIRQNGEKLSETESLLNDAIEEIASKEAENRMHCKMFNDTENKIKELESELKKLSQESANVQRRIDIVQDFSRDKNKILADYINSNMEGFKFEFMDYTAEGNPVDTCKIISNGTEYGDLNYSDKLLVQTQLVYGFQKMNDLRLPIWVDNGESINTERLPKLDTQLIVCSVSDDELKVTAL